MPRIVRIINRFNLGGITYNVSLLTKYLEPEYETILIGGVKQKSEESSEFILEQLGIKPVIIPEMSRQINLPDDVVAYRKISRIIRDFKPDIVHTHAAKAGALGRLAAFRNNVPVIVHTYHGHIFHSYFNSVKTKIFLGIERYLAKRSDVIIALSENQKKELTTMHRVCEPEKMRVIPLGFDLGRFYTDVEIKRKFFREKYLVEENEIAIGIIGRIVPVKNHALFIHSLKSVLEKTSKNIKAFIIGDGEDRKKIETLAEQSAIRFSTPEKNVPRAKLIFTSWMRDVDVAVAGLDIIAMTSLNEGTPVSIIEAQAGSKPVVATSVGGIENVVIAGETALLSPSDHVEKFSSNLLEVIENENLRKKMSQKGHEFVNNRFSYQRLAKEMSALYSELLVKKHLR